MQNFELDSRLENDTLFLATWHSSQLRLMNNQSVTWFVLIPETHITEFYQLPEPLQQELLQQINQLSRFLKEELKLDKINIATIGNVVEQMHIHIVGRKHGDYCWPNVVWGAKEQKTASHNHFNTLKEKLNKLINHHA